ncbi:unnamed protein product, partial [Heterosigma akashiwo]
SLDAQNGIFKIIFNRPSRKNALTTAMYKHITAMVERAGSMDEVNCIIITGSGDFFSSGADFGDYETPSSIKNASQSPAFRFMYALATCKKLLVAVVNGPAVGLAAAMLAHCDLVFASDTAYFWIPFFELGTVPEDCSSLLLPRIMGSARAGKMLYLGEKMSVEEAKNCGFITDYYPFEGLIQRVTHTLIEKILSTPLAGKGLQIFKHLMKGPQMALIHEVMDAELEKYVQR